MEESDEISKDGFCYACFSTNDEKRLYLYSVQNETLKAIFQLDQICLCYVCKRLAQHTDWFIQNIQNNQIYLENFENVTTTTIEAIKIQIHPQVDLTCQPLEQISLFHDISTLKPDDDENKESFTVISNGCEKAIVRIKTELKDEEDSLDDEICGDELDAYIKEEDEHPLKLLKEELESEGINIQCVRKRRRKGKNKYSTKKRKGENILPRIVKNDLHLPRVSKDYVGPRSPKEEFELQTNIDAYIEKITLTKKEILSEREEMAKDEKYLNSQYKCVYCLKGFSFKGSFETHMERHSQSKGDYECNICKLRLETADELAYHQANHRKRFKCTICNIMRANRSTVRDHYTSHHCNGAYQYFCPQCAKCFKRQASLRKHILHVHNKKRVMCDYCNKSYSGTHGLKNHLILRHPTEVSATKRPKNFICKECGMAFLSPSHLRIHSVKHSSARNFYCVECDKSFKTSVALKQHLKIAVPHVNYLELPIQCDQCEKRFSCRRGLDSHANRVHFNIKPFQCDQCDKTYTNKWSLVEHKRFIHEGEKRQYKFPCTMCDKVFDVSTNLCSQAYTRLDSLTMHKKKIHEGYTLPRKFPCPMCDKIFDRNAILKSHIRTHTGERPYQCSKCPATFSQAGILGTHMKLIHLKLTRDGRPRASNSTINVE